VTAPEIVRTASLVGALALGCATQAPSTNPGSGAAPAGAADRVYRLLAGRFDSVDQARSSPGFTALQLSACPADVPALGPRVLYVEQVRMDGTDTPDRQRVYVIDPGDPVESAAVARVFELAVAGSSVGACGLSARPRFTRDELVGAGGVRGLASRGRAGVPRKHQRSWVSDDAERRHVHHERPRAGHGRLPFLGAGF
jgi:hypothetical protein